MRAVDILINNYETELVEMLRRSKRGMEFVEHGFTIWKDDGQYFNSDIQGSEVYENIPRKIDKNEVIILKTRSSQDTVFSPEDIIQMNPFSDHFQGSTKAICALVDCGDKAALYGIERIYNNVDISTTFEVLDENEKIEQEYFQGNISEDSAIEQMIDNMNEYITTTSDSISIGTLEFIV